MKKLRLFLTTFVLLFVLAFAGCGDKAPTIDDKEVFEEELQELSDEEMASLEDGMPGTDDELDVIEDEVLSKLEDAEFVASVSDSEEVNLADGKEALGDDEDGVYTSKEEVASYIHRFGQLPSNYITKKEAKALGWDSERGNLEEVAPGMSIGGDVFGNYDKMLPDEEGRIYRECDIDYEGGFRNSKRIVYSDDGLIFYTDDHYETFEQLY